MKKFFSCLTVLTTLILSNPQSAPAQSTQPADPMIIMQATQQTLVNLTEKLSPRVVAITAWRELYVTGDTPENSNSDKSKPILVAIRGSGCILSADGQILTNEHVIRDTRRILVTLRDGRELEAQLIGSDPRNDLAVLKIDAGANDLPAIELGDIDGVRPGQFVIAMGNPLGLAADGQAAVSFGIVSAMGRHIPDIDRNVDRYYGNLILSTAPISIGNSGGPLFNLDGKVIGINTIVSASNSGGSQLAFAIPMYEWTRNIIAQIRQGKKIEYGYVGISLGNPTGKSGSIVVDILKGTPADKAGIRQNDLIIECNGQKISNSDQLIMLIGQTIPGKKISLRVARDKKTLDLTVTAAKRSDFMQEITGGYGQPKVKKHE
jgi:serine protease Do